MEAARVTLVQSVLSKLPMYYMSMFKMPDSVSNRVDQLVRNFLWGVTNDHRESRGVKWDAGLEIRIAGEMNEALLGNWH